MHIYVCVYKNILLYLLFNEFSKIKTMTLIQQALENDNESANTQ